MDGSVIIPAAVWNQLNCLGDGNAHQQGCLEFVKDIEMWGCLQSSHPPEHLEKLWYQHLLHCNFNQVLGYNEEWKAVCTETGRISSFCVLSAWANQCYWVWHVRAALEGAEQHSQSINPGLQLLPGSCALVFPWECHTWGKTDTLTLQRSPDKEHTDPLNRWNDVLWFILSDFHLEHSTSGTSKRKAQVCVTHPHREWELGENSAKYPSDIQTSFAEDRKDKILKW